MPYLVFSSVAGATADTGIPHFDSKAAIERTLAASDVPHTVVAPTYFYDNALGGYRDLLDGVLELPLPAGHPLQQLDRPDLGAFVELVLRDPQAYAGRRIELASDAPTPAQMSARWRMRWAAMSATPRCPCLPCAAAARTWLPCGNSCAARLPGRYRGAPPHYPTVGWTSFATWADRVLSPPLRHRHHDLTGQLRAFADGTITGGGGEVWSVRRSGRVIACTRPSRGAASPPVPAPSSWPLTFPVSWSLAARRGLGAFADYGTITVASTHFQEAPAG